MWQSALTSLFFHRTKCWSERYRKFLRLLETSPPKNVSKTHVASKTQVWASLTQVSGIRKTIAHGGNRRNGGSHRLRNSKHVAGQLQHLMEHVKASVRAVQKIMENSCERGFHIFHLLTHLVIDLLFLRTSLLGFIKDCFSRNFGGDASKTLDSSARLSVAGRLRITCFSRQAQIQRLDSHLVKPSACGHQAAWNELLERAKTQADIMCTVAIFPFPSISHHIFPYLSIILLCILPHSSTSLSCNICPCLAISYQISSCLSSFHILPHFTIPYRRYRILPYLIIPDQFYQYVSTS